MTTLFGDVETFNEVPIKNGHYRYAEDAELLLLAYAFDDNAVSVWDATAEPDMPGDLADAIADDSVEVVFHNSMFDRSVLNARGIRIPLHRWRDTMVQAMAHSLPGGLEKLCAILNVPLDQRKLAEGKDLIRLFCKPLPKNQKLRRATRETHPRQWQQFIEYAGHDIEAMRAIRKRLPNWNYIGAGLDLWHLDQRINDRGVPVDASLAAAAIRAAERAQRALAAGASDLTGGEVGSTTQRDALLAHILTEYAVDLPDLKGDTIERRVNDPDLPWQVRALLVNRMEASRASTAKYKAMLRSVCRDGRIRGTLQYCGAQRTARWAGRLIQPQNFMRTPKYLAGDESVAFAADAITADAVDLLLEGTLYTDNGIEKRAGTMEILAAGVPWAIAAPKGRKLVALDLSNIEGRVLAWLAGEQWKLRAFEEQDADPKNKTKDLYIIGYAKSFNEAIADVVADYAAGGKKRQIGKVQELALGYQGGVGAFVSMAKVYRIDLNELAAAIDTLPKGQRISSSVAWEVAQSEGRTFDLERNVYIVCHAFAHLWRAANPNTKQFWYDLQDAARNAICAPGERFPVGRLEYQRLGNWLRCRLPSGWYLCYPNPRVEDGKISYMGVNQYTRKWQRIYTYGGKLAENATQAIATGAGGILGAALPRLEEAGYELIFHVHDEPVAEVPDTEDYSAEEMGEILATNPPWADGLPLAVGGYETYRYRKD